MARARRCHQARWHASRRLAGQARRARTRDAHSRSAKPRDERHTVFRVGEIHGSITARATELVEILNAVDSAKVTQNLWGERWTKLATNSITHGVLGATGEDNRSVYIERGTAHRLGVRL